MLAPQVGLVFEKEIEESGEANDQKPSKPLPDRGLRECMNGTDDSAAGEECSQYCEPEGGENQPRVPDLQHAALFLHHDGVKKSCAREPRHQRCVFDGIPSPITSPTENRIGPV